MDLFNDIMDMIMNDMITLDKGSIKIDGSRQDNPPLGTIKMKQVDLLMRQ
jgi:hypothetical protein